MNIHPFEAVLIKAQKTAEDKALIAAVILLSTQHDHRSEARSFSHLTMWECFDKLVSQWESLVEEVAAAETPT